MFIIKKSSEYLRSFIDLIFPNICIACNSHLAGNEQYVCTPCLANLPKTGFWKHEKNPVAEIFWGRVKLENASSFVFFEKESAFQHILHHIKYQNKAELGIQMGKAYGKELKGSFITPPDCIVPIPLHKSRQRKRGYNQSEKISIGLSEALKIPVISKACTRKIATKTQTNKARFNRWQNVEGVFKVTNTEVLQNKHILVVDDVVTTGATSESFMQELIKIQGVTLSFVALAHA